LPLAGIATKTGLTREVLATLAAFDIIRIEGEACRFADGQTLKTAGEIIAAGRSLGDCVRILARARDLAPKGRRRIVLDGAGGAALEWESGRTTLEGQGVLPFDESHASVEDLFEAAVLAESEGDLAGAARLYDMCARADRRDAIALYNLGNVHLQAKAYDEAILAYARATRRDPDFVEAHYNLALACEAIEQFDRARESLAAVLKRDAMHADALFNLAQLDLNGGDIAAAKARFEAYLAADPPSDWAEKARRAISYCNARLRA
jgi:tetratricopeptide (TPR) repeat protein